MVSHTQWLWRPHKGRFEVLKVRWRTLDASRRYLVLKQVRVFVGLIRTHGCVGYTFKRPDRQAPGCVLTLTPLPFLGLRIHYLRQATRVVAQSP